MKAREVQLEGKVLSLHSVIGKQEQLEEQLKAEKAASCQVADEKLQLEIRMTRLLKENEELHKVTADMAKDKVQLQMKEKLSQAEIQELRRWSVSECI